MRQAAVVNAELGLTPSALPSIETSWQVFLKTAILVAVSLLVRIAYLKFRPIMSVSVDMLGWYDAERELLAGRNPYVTTHWLNWPPMWLILIYYMSRISALTGVWLVTVIFTILIAVEQLLLIATIALIRKLCPGRRWFAAVLVGIALNPVAILQTTQHGNFDVFLSLFLMCALLFAIKHLESQRPEWWLYACLFVGLATFTKTVGLIYVALMLPGSRKVSPAYWPIGLALAFGPAALGLATIYVFAPAGVWDHVIQYRSIYGFFGIGGLMLMYGGDAAAIQYQHVFTIILALVMGGVCLHLLRRHTLTSEKALLLAIALLLGVSTLGPGWGPQYAYWYLPLLTVSYVMFADRFWRLLLLATYAVAAITYLVQYMVNDELGETALKLMPHNSGLRTFQINWTDSTGQTLFRMPLFLLLIVTLLNIPRLWRLPSETSAALTASAKRA